MSGTVDLCRVPCEDWKIGKVIVLDWYDGPREGICSLEYPAALVYFRLLAERQVQDGLDDRLFSLFRLSEATFTTILSLFGIPPGSETPKVFLPSPHPALSGESLREKVGSLTGNLEALDIIIRSRDMHEIQSCWREDHGRKVDDWFAELGIESEGTGQ